MKKTYILIGIILVVVLAGVLLLKSQGTANSGNANIIASTSPSPTPFPEVFEEFGGQIKTLSPQKITMQDKDGNLIDVMLSEQVKYYDNSPREPKEITFSAFHTGEWIGVRGWATHTDPTKPASLIRAEGVFKGYAPGTRPDTGE
jgi:hypothetical protein